MKEELDVLLNLQDVRKINSFTDISQESCQDFKQHCIPFQEFLNINFTENLSITTYDSSARVTK